MTVCMLSTITGCANEVAGIAMLCAEHSTNPYAMKNPPPPGWGETMTACGCGWDGHVDPVARGQRCPRCGTGLT